MTLRDLLKKKDKHEESSSPSSPISPNRPSSDDRPSYDAPAPPEFRFVRSDTNTEEIISPPSFYSDVHPPTPNKPVRNPPPVPAPAIESPPPESRNRFTRLRARSRAASSPAEEQLSRSLSRNRISQRLGLHRGPPSSSYVPDDLPDIPGGSGDAADEEQWEQRATRLAKENQRSRSASRPPTPPRISNLAPQIGSLNLTGDEARVSIERARSQENLVSTKKIDDNIQEAIRLHEAGELGRATRMFGRLADPNGENNALSQVLYGLALRHGWGCQKDPEKAIVYLSAAASNAASIEDLALQAGLKRGGAAKGELVLAIFELANCFRNGWGVEKDPVAAKQYYETAANLGDTDAMNEVGWCYLEGFGCKKDKFAAAKYYRLAEKAGHKTLGNSWVWKSKYDPK